MIIISPAKKLNFTDLNLEVNFSNPSFIEKTKLLVKKLRKLDAKEIQSLMNISDKLSELNVQRYKDFSVTNEYVSERSKPAIFAFAGDTFNGLSSHTFNKNDIKFAQSNLRILSGLYGYLKPLDLIQPHRLEMGTNTKRLIDKSLYDFWSDDITKIFNKDIEANKSKIIFNLSSFEYFKSLDKEKINADVITPSFYVKKNNVLKSSGMLSKKCRGSMARMIIKNKYSSIDDLKKFNDFGYKFDSEDRKNKTIIFVKK